MRFSQRFCPECGKIANGTLELTPGIALLDFNEDGTAEYDGETELDYNGQYSVIVPQAPDYVFLECQNGHFWPAKMTED